MSVQSNRPALDSNDRLAHKLAHFVVLDSEELKYVQRLQKPATKFPKGRQLITQGESCESIYILMDGWAASGKWLPTGTRQITRFIVPGDFIGLHANWLRISEVTVEALTDITVAAFQPQRLLTLVQRFPRLGAAIAWAGAIDEAMSVEHMVSLGRRNADERLAYLLLELYKRLEIVGLADTASQSFHLPLSQEVLADYLGMTHIHVSRTLSKLVRKGLLTYSRDKVTMIRLDHLRDLAQFDERNLSFEPPSEMTLKVLNALSLSEESKESLERLNED